MNLQYGGTKKTIDKDRKDAVESVKSNPVDKARAAAVNSLVDAFLKDKTIADDTSVSVTAVTTDRAMSVNVTLNQETFVAPTPVTTESNSKPLTKSAEKSKQDANAKTVTKRVERIAPEDAKDGNTAPEK